ncbi:MAG: amidohydrolase family protein [Planctomycetes bacterium]|nr:amidohydrolase family protein [Planctomycetota bacterium]MCB9902786.1 amidohydrolase family protein [Planctomycetota bacterium]
MRFSNTIGAAFAAVALFAATPAAKAALLSPQDEESSDESGEEGFGEDDGPETHYFAVRGADVYTGTGEVLRGATVLAKNGRIKAIGYDVEIPGLDFQADVPSKERGYTAEVLDAAGYRVYPGMVAIESSGLLGTGGDYRDSIDPFDQNMILGLSTGITSTGQSNAACKLKRYISQDPPVPYDFDGIVLRDDCYANFSWGSGSARRSVREKLVRASEYLREYRQWQIDVKNDKELKEPSKKGVDNSVLDVLQGNVLAKFRADSREDLLGIARIAQEFGFRPAIDGCREGWTVAAELGRAGAFAIVTPRERRDKSEMLVREGGSSIENAAILYAAGVQVAIKPASRGISLGGITGRDIMHLPVEVGFAIRGGLPEDAAIAAVTTVPARMMGVSHRVGTLEVGKDCDLIVTDGDLLHYQTFVQWTVIDGQVVYDKQDELYFAHIRPRAETEVAPLRRLDAGENEEAAEEGDSEADGDDDKDKQNGKDEEE